MEKTLDLRLLKKMVLQLEEQLSIAEEVRQGVDLSAPQNKEVFDSFMVEMSKVHGILVFLSKESLDLTKDIINVLKLAGLPSDGTNQFETLLNKLIPPPSNPTEGNGGKFNN